MLRSLRTLALLLPVLFGTGCVKKLAVNAMASALSGDTGGAFTQDDDLQLVGEAIPFALKLMESVHEQAPEHAPLTLTLCSSYTQYALVYVKWPAEQARHEDFAAYEAGTARSKKFLGRAHGYCMDAWELEHPGFGELLRTDPGKATALAEKGDVPLLYWTGATWLSRISLSKDDMAAIGELPLAAALIARAAELDPDWDRGSLHDLQILLEPSLPAPGGMDRARAHFEKAVELAAGTRASPYVSLATSVSVTEQNRDEFTSLMEKALAIDPLASEPDMLANLYAQEQARYYLDHLDDLFF